MTIMRSSFSTSAPGSMVTLPINAKTVDELSNGGVCGSTSTGRLIFPVSGVRLPSSSIRTPPHLPLVHHRSARVRPPFQLAPRQSRQCFRRACLQ